MITRCWGRGGGGAGCQGHRGTFGGGGGNVLGLDCGGDSKTVKVCQDALTCPPKEENFQRTKMRRSENNRQTDPRDGGETDRFLKAKLTPKEGCTKSKICFGEAFLKPP